SRRMTYQELVEELNYTGYAAQVAEANNKYEGDVIEAGETVRIPPLTYEIPETAWNGKAPSVDSIIGSLYPTLPMPHIWLAPKKIKTNYYALFLETAAFVAIMATLPGALGAGGGLIDSMVAYAIAGAVANTVDQLIAMGFGQQTEFNFKSLGIATVTSAVSGAV